MTSEYSPGLEGIIAGQSSVSTIIEEKAQLTYRGYNIHDLTEHSNFEEVAYLLLYGELPTDKELSEFDKYLRSERSIPAEVADTLKKLPKNIHPMDGLRTGVSVLSAFDADVLDDSHDANLRKARRLIAKVPTIVAAFCRMREGNEMIEPDDSLAAAGNFLYMINGKKPSDDAAKVMDMSLMCYAEHGFNASTFFG